MRRLLLACLTAATLGSFAPSAHAATYVTEGCPDSAPQWRILYRMYFSDSAGRTIPGDTLPAALANAQRFAQDTGELSECAVRIHVDVIEDAGVWTGDRSVPAGYDALLIRHPAVGDEGYVGQTDYKSAVFPVRDTGEPNHMLLMHEWLHIVVSFYRTPLGWPADDVHGACARPDYTGRGNGWPCMVNSAWFSDLMTGRIIENGQPRGLPKDQWAYQGTPTHPLHQPAEVSVAVAVDDRVIELSGPAGTGQLTITDAAGRTVHNQTVTLTGTRASRVTLPAVGYGRFTACLRSPETLLHVAGEGCETFTLRPSTEALLSVARAKGGTVLLRARPPLRGRTVTVRFRSGACTFSCIRERKGGTRTVRLRSKLTLRAPEFRASKRNGGYIYLDIQVKAFTAGGVRYPALSRSYSAR